MQLDPQKQIEDLLKASARERREKFGAEPKMPGPMRTQLQAEIARMNERVTPTDGTGWFFQWWPRLAIAAVVTLLVSLPLYRELTRQNLVVTAAEGGAGEARRDSDEVASANAPVGVVGVERSAELFADSALEKEIALTGAAVSELAESSKPGEIDGRFASSDSLEKKLDTKPASAPAAIAQAVQSEAIAGRDKPAMQQFTNIQLQDKDAVPASKALIAQNAIGKKSNLQGQVASSSLRQEFRANLKVKQAANVLNRFQFEQTGNSIRIYDADGSTYSGEIRQIAAKGAGGEDRSRGATVYESASKAESAGEKTSSGLAGVNGFYFRAAGANRSLNKSVVIEGNYIQQAQPARAAADQSSSSAEAGVRIVGHAKINGGAEVEIDAVSIPQQ